MKYKVTAKEDLTLPDRPDVRWIKGKVYDARYENETLYLTGENGHESFYTKKGFENIKQSGIFEFVEVFEEIKNDLISRKALLEDIAKICKQIEIRGFVQNNYTYETIKEVFNLINEQPTAYDVDAVVAKLETVANIYTPNFAEDDYGSGYTHGVVESIEIVKGGGIND